MFDPIKQRGDASATLARSADVLPELRAVGVPAALVFQDGLQRIADQIDWDSFDVAFLGGSDQFKLGYYNRRKSGWLKKQTSAPTTWC